MLLFENNQVYFKFDPDKANESNSDALSRIITNHPILKHLTAGTNYYLPYVTEENKRRYAKDKKSSGYINPLELVEDYFLKARPIIEDIDENALFDISSENVIITKKSVQIRTKSEDEKYSKGTKDYNFNRVALLVSYQNFLNGYLGGVRVEERKTKPANGEETKVYVPINDRGIKIHSPVLKGHFTELFVRLYYSYRLPRDNWFFIQNQAEIFKIVSKKILKGHFLFSNFQNKDERRQYNNRQFKEILLLFVFATFNLAKNLKFSSEEISMSPSRGERDMLMVIGENYQRVLSEGTLDDTKERWSELYTSSIFSFITKLGLSGYRSKTIRALENYALYHGEMQEKEEFVAKKPDIESFFYQCARIAELYEDEEMEIILDENFSKELTALYQTSSGRKITKYLDKLKEEKDNYRKIFIVSIIMQTYKKFAEDFIKEVSNLKFKNIVYNEKKILLTAFKEDITWKIFLNTNNTQDFVDYIREFLNEDLKAYYEDEEEEISPEELLEIKINSQKNLAELFAKDIVQIIPNLFGNIAIDKFPDQFIEVFKALLMYQFETTTGEKINVPIPDLSKEESSFLFSSMGVDIYDNVEKTFDELLSGVKDYSEDTMERPRRSYINYNSNEEYEHYNYKLQLLIKYIEAREPHGLSVGKRVLESLFDIQRFIAGRQYFTEKAKDQINFVYNKLFQGKQAFETITDFEKTMASVEVESEKVDWDFVAKSRRVSQEGEKSARKYKALKPADDNFEKNLQEICELLAEGNMPTDVAEFSRRCAHISEHFFKNVLNAQQESENTHIFEIIIEKIMEIIKAKFEGSDVAKKNATDVFTKILQTTRDSSVIKNCGIFIYVLSSAIDGDIIIPPQLLKNLAKVTSDGFVKSLQKFIDEGSTELSMSTKDKFYFDDNSEKREEEKVVDTSAEIPPVDSSEEEEEVVDISAEIPPVDSSEEEEVVDTSAKIPPADSSEGEEIVDTSAEIPPADSLGGDTVEPGSNLPPKARKINSPKPAVGGKERKKQKKDREVEAAIGNTPEQVSAPEQAPEGEPPVQTSQEKADFLKQKREERKRNKEQKKKEIAREKEEKRRKQEERDREAGRIPIPEETPVVSIPEETPVVSISEENTFEQFSSSAEFEAIKNEVEEIEDGENYREQKVKKAAVRRRLLARCDELNFDEEQKEILLSLASLD